MPDGLGSSQEEGCQTGHIATKRTSEMLSAICESLRRGATRAAAARANGINRDTLYEWMKDPDISDAFARAESEFRSRVEQKFADDALNGGDWRARESLLKRRYREDWGDKIDLEGLPDHIVLQALGVRPVTAAAYPSASQYLLTGRHTAECDLDRDKPDGG